MSGSPRRLPSRARDGSLQMGAMATKGDGFSAGADLLRKLFSAEYGKTKTIVTGFAFILAALPGLDRYGVAAGLMLAAVTAAVAFAVLASLLEGWQKLKNRRPEEQFRQLRPALEAYFWDFHEDGVADPLEADRLSSELRRLDIWVASPQVQDPDVLRPLIDWARQDLLWFARMRYPNLMPF